MDEQEQVLQKLHALEHELQASKQELEAARSRHECQVELLKAGTIDLESAGILLEKLVTEGASAAEAVKQLRERKPHLFRQSSPASRGSAQSAMGALGRAGAEEAAQAAGRGDRRALLEYMRLRRERGGS